MKAAKTKAKSAAKNSNGRVERLSKDVRALRAYCDRLGASHSILVPITTLDPEPYELGKEILVVVQPDHDSFVATFFDANINASGKTQVDAVVNLKYMMIAILETLEKERKLGKGPTAQLAVLRGLIRRKGRDAAHQ